MRVVIAPDKFKGCLSAAQVSQAMSAGVQRARPDAQIDLCPMSDGGEGFVEAMVGALGGRFVKRRVTGPIPDMKVDAIFGVVGDSAIIEMSAASGIALLPLDQRDPHATTTFGTGELLLAAVEQGCTKILLGIGGSATIDGGIGCCQAAGLPVLLDDGAPTALTEPLCGRDLPRIVLIKSHRGEKLAGVDITVACDVTNPLCGEDGAARVFGPQKGARPEQVDRFDEWLALLARRCGAQDIAQKPGAGAAGGLGFAMMAFFNATLAPGAEMVIEATNLRRRLAGADLCITGEGRFDESSLAGKAPMRVHALCHELGVDCAAVFGSREQIQIDPPLWREVVLSQLAGSESEAIRNAPALIERAAELLVSAHPRS